MRLGEARVVNFVAENRSGQAITGQALPSIAPWKASGFFSKIECFCFTQQTLAGDERKEMPVRVRGLPGPAGGHRLPDAVLQRDAGPKPDAWRQPTDRPAPINDNTKTRT